MLSIEEIHCFIRMIERQYSCRICIMDAFHNDFFAKFFPDIDTLHLNEGCNMYNRVMGYEKKCMKCDAYDCMKFGESNHEPFWKICPAGLMELVCTIAFPGRKTFQIFIGTFKPRNDLPEHHLNFWPRNNKQVELPAKELTDVEFAELPVLARLLTEKLVQCIEKENSEKKQLPPDPETFITNYIDINFRSDVSLAELAEKLGWSASHTTVRIRQFFGKTFLDLLTERRIKNAKWLLQSHYCTNNATIAAVSGFQTSSNFYKCFRKYTGMTPNEFRRKNAKKNKS